MLILDQRLPGRIVKPNLPNYALCETYNNQTRFAMSRATLFNLVNQIKNRKYKIINIINMLNKKDARTFLFPENQLLHTPFAKQYLKLNLKPRAVLVVKTLFTIERIKLAIILFTRLIDASL